MDFEPRLFDNQPKTDDVPQLPEGLAALGEQLSADADRLAALYPPRGFQLANQPKEAAPRRGLAPSRWLHVATVAGLITAAGLAGAALSRRWVDDDSAKIAGATQPAGETQPTDHTVEPDHSRSLAAAPLTSAEEGAADTSHIGEVGLTTRHSSTFGADDQVRMLKLQLDGFEQVIVRLQAELKRRDQQQQETAQLIQTLRGEVDTLRRQLADQPPTATK